MSKQPIYVTSYGKCRVPVYRVYANPLAGIRAIPESPFRGRSNTLLAIEVDIEVFGDSFLSSYTHGDNTHVVATDSMKNVALKEALAFDGATPEGYLVFLGRSLLEQYAEMEWLRLTARDLPFGEVTVPAPDGTWSPSATLFAAGQGDRGIVTLDCRREDGTMRVTEHRCGRIGLHLLKVTGSAFTRFVRDEHTTLPERIDRPLFIVMDVFWRYTNVEDLVHADGYVPSEQVRDVVTATFHSFVSESIQHLVHEMGTRLLARFPQLAEVSFEAQNHTWDPAAVSDADPRIKVYTTPFPAYGLIKLSLRREG
ncbi:MAG: hypothetical protein NVSMB65_14050 [Chloroflexota bacterium]